MDPTRLIKQDHRRVEKLFARYGRTRGKQKTDIVAALKRELDVHAAVEEEVLYPAVREIKARSRPLVAEAYEEHALVKTILRDLASRTPDDESYDAKVTVLRRLVEEHVAEEEARGGILAQASALPKARREQLGQEIADKKRSLQRGVEGVLTSAAEMTQGLIEREQRLMDRAAAVGRSVTGRVARTVRRGRGRRPARGRAGARGGRARTRENARSGARSGARSRARRPARSRSSRARA